MCFFAAVIEKRRRSERTFYKPALLLNSFILHIWSYDLLRDNSCDPVLMYRLTATCYGERFLEKFSTNIY
ncbi:hypothetical protein A7K91_12335 [Paenibacillus oryzae]|uniref:Uncharacterized protein n=1 Tax=Paenibacillus oryzae TaxID=1844972 RepID=A0A1A5YFE9_9BACL|nr:hypothetical protein A7K91_12335 [Paenibacillus oryzae]